MVKITLKIGSIIGIGMVIGWSCSSDCLQCHPKLKPLEMDNSNPYYSQHHFLVNCTKCHPNHSKAMEKKCGADCFECHSRKKLIQSSVPAHRRLKECTRCHTPAIKDLIPSEENPFQIFK